MPAEVDAAPARAADLGRARQGVCRLPARLRPDVHRPWPSRGDGGGAEPAAARLDLLRQQPPRHRARPGDRRRRALRRAGALRLHRHRGRPLRHAGGARLPQARQDPEVRGRLSRHERLRADVDGAQEPGQLPAADPRFGRHPQERRRRDADRGLQRPRDGREPDQGAQGRARRRDRRAVPAPAAAAARLPRRGCGSHRRSTASR